MIIRTNISESQKLGMMLKMVAIPTWYVQYTWKNI